MSRLKALAVLSLWVILGSQKGAGQSAGHAGWWKGELRTYEFSFGPERVGLTQYNYNVYGSPQQIVRHELTYMSRNPGAEVGREVQLIDYANGIGLAYDIGRARAVKYRLKTIGSVSALEHRRILGHDCAGTHNQWQDPDGDVHVRETWVAADVHFKDPLLTVEYGIGGDKRFNYYTFSTMVQLDAVEFLDPSIFSAPGGLEITDSTH